MKLAFYGAARTVTGSCYLLDTGEHKILVDCGMFQGSKAIKERNYQPFPFTPEDIDLVVLTHAHIDHSGMVPKLFKHGYRGKVLCTMGTAELCSVMLPDSGHIQEMEVERKNRKILRSGGELLEPVYTAQEAKDCLDNFQGMDYNVWNTVMPGVELCFHDAGHILGSAMVEFKLQNGEGKTSLVFSGDLGNDGQPIVNDPYHLAAADYLVMESTYGDRVREKQGEEAKLAQLASAVNDTFKRGGNLVIPAFAVERTQDLLYYLNLLIRRGDISSEQIYIDSPLAVAATEIFCNHPEYFDPETRALQEQTGSCPLFIKNFNFSTTVEDSMAINRIKKGALIISASGMCDAGRIKHHLKHNLWREECTVLLVGYQAQGTLGRRLLEGARKVCIHGEEIAVRAEIRNLTGFSAHADQQGLLDWISSFRKKVGKVFVTHGEEQSSNTFAKLLHDRLGLVTVVPAWLEEVDLHTGNTTKAPTAEHFDKAFNSQTLWRNYRQLQSDLSQWFEQMLASGSFEQGVAKIKEISDKLTHKTN